MKKQLSLLCLMIILLAGCREVSLDHKKNQAQGEIHSLELTINQPKNVQLYQDARSFSEQVAWVKHGGRWHLVDQKGQVQFSLNKDEFPNTNFTGGVAIIDKRRMINKNGETIFDVRIEGFDEFMVGTDQQGRVLGSNSRGFVFVRRDEKTVVGEITKIALVDPQGQVVVKASELHNRQRYAGDGQFELGYRQDHLQMFNSDRQQIYQIEDPQAKLTTLKFNDNYGVEQYGTDQFPFLFDQYGGKKQLTLGFDPQQQVRNGLVGVYSSGLFFYRGQVADKQVQGFFNKEGKLIIDLVNKPIATTPYPFFAEGYCLLRNLEKDSFYLLDKDGNQTMEAQKGDTEGAEISNGSLRVKEGHGDYRFIDMAGETILTIKGTNYATIEDDQVSSLDVASFHDDWVRVKTEGRAFYLNKTGDYLTVDFSQIRS